MASLIFNSIMLIAINLNCGRGDPACRLHVPGASLIVQVWYHPVFINKLQFAWFRLGSFHFWNVICVLNAFTGHRNILTHEGKF